MDVGFWDDPRSGWWTTTRRGHHRGRRLKRAILKFALLKLLMDILRHACDVGSDRPDALAPRRSDRAAGARTSAYDRNVNEAIAHFEHDLAQAGVETRGIATLVALYRSALVDASERAWNRLYRAIFSSLRALSRRSSARIQSRSALESVLRLVEDDFGFALFGAPAVSRLRASLAPDDQVSWKGTKWM